MRLVHDYRTPSGLRSYAMVWLTMSSFMLSPLFAKYSVDYGIAAGIYSAVIVSLMLAGLNQIFTNEEDGFDGQGVDDLSLDSLSTLTSAMFDKPEAVRRRRVLHPTRRPTSGPSGARMRPKPKAARFEARPLDEQAREVARTADPKNLGRRETFVPFVYFDQ